MVRADSSRLSQSMYSTKSSDTLPPASVTPPSLAASPAPLAAATAPNSAVAFEGCIKREAIPHGYGGNEYPLGVGPFHQQYASRDETPDCLPTPVDHAESKLELLSRVCTTVLVASKHFDSDTAPSSPPVSLASTPSELTPSPWVEMPPGR